MIHSDKTNNYAEFFYKTFRNILLVSAPLTIISALILSLPHSSAYSSSTDSVALTLPSACSISASVVTPHTITLVNGQKQDDIGNTKINAYCNDNNGYFIYAIGSSNDIAGNTDLISSVNDNYNIHTGIYPTTLTTSTPSSWAMKLSSNNGTYAPTITPSYANYTTIPSADTIVAYRTSGTGMDINTDLTGSYFNTTYQIYANPIQPAGTYLGKVKYTMTHPYDATQLTTIEEAYDIAGKDKVTITDPTTGETIGSYYSMQDMSDRICNLVNYYETEEQLVDVRDDKIYYVSKLTDGHCWMTQNLDLDLDPAKPLTSNDTDLTDHSLTGAYVDDYSYDMNTGITTWTPERKTIDFQNTAVNGWASDNNNPYSASKTDNTKTGHTSLGNYYNWPVAIASNNSSSLIQDTLNNTANNPKNSICPKGWRLPIISSEPETLSGSTNEFARLNYLYNNNSGVSDANLIIAPLWFTRSGSIDGNGNLVNYNTNSNCWSSTVVRDTSAYYALFSEYYVNMIGGKNISRYYGRSVRCVAR